MATKQGLTAQISQASEDAKRAVLQRSTAVIKSSSQWFSNLNTTCTIKSAPPRTPDVLQLLSVKSGFLYKRNEQHVWQARWCCVVPHMFLYYFDAIPLPQPRAAVASAAAAAPSKLQIVALPPPPPTLPQQEAWNTAVRCGYDGIRGKQGPRSSLYHVFPTNGGGGGGGGSSSSALPEGQNMMTSANYHHGAMMESHYHDAVATTTTTTTTSSSSSSSLPTPAGIIDLECYTSVHRSSQNPLVLELAGDDAVNPDLRGFYFVARDEMEAEDWTQALLSQRHSQLLDERDAYQQVCDGFAIQLQELHSHLDTCQVELEQAKEEVYTVRCQMEDQRRSCWKLVEEAMEQQQESDFQHGNNNNSNHHRSNNLEEIRSQDGSALAAMQLLFDYTKSLEEACAQLQLSNVKLQKEKEAFQQERSEQDVHSKEKAELQAQLRDWQTQYQRLQETYQAERLVWQQDTSAQKATLQQYKTKLKEMQAHKKILKREVIELRKKCEEMESEVNLLQHRHGKELEHEQSKLELLERYLAKMESQVKVQQNMMEMMSSSMSIYGGGSHYIGGEGGGGGGGGGNASANVSLRGAPLELPRSIVAPRPYYHHTSSMPTSPSSARASIPAGDMNHNDITRDERGNGLVSNNNIQVSNNNINSGNKDQQRQQRDGDADDDDDDGVDESMIRGGVSILQNTTTKNTPAAVITSSTTLSSANNVSPPLMLPPTPRRNTQPLTATQQQQQNQRLDDSYQEDEDDFKRSNYIASNNMAMSALPDDMDNKSHLSELTEDRTQKHFDYVYHHHHHHHQQQQQQQLQQQQQDSPTPKGGNNSRNANNVASPNNDKSSTRNNNNSSGGPPSFIMGGVEKSAALSSSQLQQPPPHHPHLDTITSRAATTTTTTTAITTSASLSPSSPTRSSVAHRARMDADKSGGSTLLKVRAPFLPTNSSPQKGQTRGSGAASVSSNASNASQRGDRSIATAGSFLSNLGRRLEQALDNSILGVPDISTESSLQSGDFYDHDDDELDDEDDQNRPYRHSRTPFEEKKIPEGPLLNVPNSNKRVQQPQQPQQQQQTQQQQQQQQARQQQQQQQVPSGAGPSHTTSRSDSVTVSVVAAAAAVVAAVTSPKSMSPSGASQPNSGSLSLQERQKLQRAKQLAFLKQQGIIQKDDEVRGGAGSVVGGGGGGGSVDSSPSTWVDSTVSLTTATSLPSTGTPKSVQPQRPRKTTAPRRVTGR